MLRFIATATLALLAGGACDSDDHPCPGAECPHTVSCAKGRALVVLAGACCPSCELLAVDAGDGCSCDPERDPVCGEDLQPYTNACFARCAGVEVLQRGACPSRAQFPPDHYGDPCESDDVCHAPYQCLPSVRGDTVDMERSVCTTRCESAADCPQVVSDHCGDQTLCTDGICGFWLCD